MTAMRRALLANRCGSDSDQSYRQTYRLRHHLHVIICLACLHHAQRVSVRVNLPRMFFLPLHAGAHAIADGNGG